jgi:hypothetical protein
MLPDMSSVLTAWESPFTIKTVTKTTVNFQPVVVVVARTQNCVVQVARIENLILDTINYALQYLMVHSKENIDIDELLVYQGRDFIIVQSGQWDGYGYTECVAEETKRAVVAVT